MENKFKLDWFDYDVAFSESSCHNIGMSGGCGEDCPIFQYDTCPYAMEGFESGNISMTAMLETGHMEFNFQEFITMYANNEITLAQYLEAIRYEWGITNEPKQSSN